MTRKATDFIVIHCSATPPGMDIGGAEIDRWHRSRGWLRIGYHFVIRRNGVIDLGRAPATAGAHVNGYNDRSIGICLVGGVSELNLKRAEKNFTSMQWPILHKLVNDMLEIYPGAKIVGHNDLNHTKKCPSFNVKEWLDDRQ